MSGPVDMFIVRASDMFGSGCFTCDGGGHVCENHVDRPWDGTSTRADACDCGGAGMPCWTCSPREEVCESCGTALLIIVQRMLEMDDGPAKRVHTPRRCRDVRGLA